MLGRGEIKRLCQGMSKTIMKFRVWSADGCGQSGTLAAVAFSSGTKVVHMCHSDPWQRVADAEAAKTNGLN